METEVKGQQQQLEQLTETVTEQNSKIEMLEQTLGEQQRQLHDTRAREKQQIQALTRQLEEKSDMAASLMSQLHALQLEKKASSKRKEVARCSSSSSEDSRTISPHFFQPTPPKERPAPGQLHIRRWSGGAGNRSVDLQSHVLVSHVRNRPPSTRRLSRGETVDDSIPDPTPFLRGGSNEDMMSKKEGKTVLPPIQKSQAQTATLVLSPTNKHRTVWNKEAMKKADSLTRSSPEVEVETLAVKNLIEKEQDLGKSRPFQSSN